MSHSIQTKNVEFTFFDLVTLDDIELTQGHKRLRRVLESVPDTIHVVPSALFQSDMAAFPGQASNNRYLKKNVLRPDL